MKTPAADHHTEEEGVPPIALISPDPSFRTLVKRCVDDAAPRTEWVLRADSSVESLGPESVDELLAREPALLIVDVGGKPATGARFIEAVTSRAPGLTVVAAGNRLEGDELLGVVRAGASEYLQRPFDPDEVADACSRIMRRVLSDPAGSEGTKKARTLALFSPKGGTGVSTLATNLAVHIGTVTEKKTLLLDLAPGMGSCALLLGVEPRYSYLDVVESLDRMDRRLLQSYLTEHESGTKLLGSPADVRPGRSLTEQDVRSVVRLLQRNFDYLVIDVGRRAVDPVATKACELADDTLVMTTPELPTLRAVKRVLPHLEGTQSEAEDSSMRLVVNRYRKGESVSRKDVEKAVGAPVYQVVREDTVDLSRSVNLGEPIVLNGSSPYSKGVRAIGNRIAEDDLPQGHGASRIARFFRSVLPPYGRNGRIADDENSSGGEDR